MNSNRHANNNFSSSLGSIFLIFSVCLIALLIWKIKHNNVPLFELIVQFKNTLYFPHFNFFTIGKTGNQHSYEFFYKFLLITLAAATTYFQFFVNSRSGKNHTKLSQIVTSIGIFGLLLLLSIQQIRRHEHFIYEINKFSGKTTNEKNLLLFGPIYQFSQLGQELLPGKHQGTVMTDLNFLKNPHIFNQRLLSYYFYPKLSLRFNNQSPKDCLILFSKKDPLKHIPKNYRILATAGNLKYILAVKE